MSRTNLGPSRPNSGPAIQLQLEAALGDCWSVLLARFYFRLHGGTIRTPQVIEFLKALQATIGKRMLINWDRLQAHRSKLVRAHVEAQRGAIALEYLPAYAPELNPVEYIWGYLKHHAMPNFCARDLGDLAHRARGQLRSMQRRSTLVCAFWRQAELF